MTPRWEPFPFPELSQTLARLRHDVYAVTPNPLGFAALFGSTVMALAGLRQRCGDVDLAVQEHMYRALATRPGWVEQRPNPRHPAFLRFEGTPLTIDAFRAWRHDEPETDVREMLREARLDLTAGLPAIPLWLVRKQKVGALRYFAEQHPGEADTARVTKNRLDIEIIDRSLAYLEMPVEVTHGDE